MKKNNAIKGLIPRLLIILCSTFAVLSAQAYDFSAVNEDDVTIYYIITGDELVSVTNNGDNDYSNSYSGDVVIPSEVIYNGTTYSVTSIGYSAFYDCPGLTSVEIPNSVTDIDYYAFYGCSSLTSVKIGSSITVIGEEAFYGCTTLKEVVLEDADAPLAFGASVFENTPIETLYVGRNFTCSTSSGKKPFSGKSTINTLTLGSLVTNIEDYTFDLCKGLKNVTLIDGEDPLAFGKSVFDPVIENLYLGRNISYTPIKYANVAYPDTPFNNNPSLNTLTIGELVTSIGVDEFSGCTGLTSVEIPSLVRYINDSAFKGCTGLTSVNIGESVTSIGDYAFESCKLTSLEFSNSLQHIGNFAFNGSPSLTSLEIPSSVTYIGEGAFYSCRGIKNLIIADGIGSIGIGQNAFYECPIETLFLGRSWYIYDVERNRSIFSGKNIISLTIGNQVTDIPRYAFANCTGLTSVEIPNSVTSIYNCAFQFCTGLTSIKIGNSVTYIGEGAFKGATGITSVVFADGNKSIDFGESVFEEVPIETVYLGRDFTVYSSKYAPFLNKTTINSLTLSDSVTSLSDFAFSGCTGLTSVEFPASVTNIGKMAFNGITGLTSLYFPDSLGRIGDSAFKDCSGVKDVRFPWDLENIGSSAFENCVGLTEISLGFSNDDEATYSSSNIKLILGENAFKGCLRLKNLTLGANISSIGKNGFGGDWQLATITVENPDPVDITLGQEVFDGVDHQTCELKVPVGSIALYSAAPQWKDFTNIQETVVKKSQEILWDQTFEDVKVGDVLILTAEATSGLNVEYTITLGSDIATLEGNKVKIIGTGTVEITATQDGNDIYKSAEPVVKRIDNIINGIAGIMMDNDSDVTVINLHGQVLYQGKAVEMPRFTPGTYIIRCGDKTVKVRI